MTKQPKFDPETDQASHAVIDALSEITDSNPVDLDPLAESVDPDALDGIFQPKADGTPRDSDRHVEFIYMKYSIQIHSDGKIRVEGAEDPASE